MRVRVSSRAEYWRVFVGIIWGKVQHRCEPQIYRHCIRISGRKVRLLLMCFACRSNQSLNASGGNWIMKMFLTIVSWIPVASVKAQRRLTVWPGYDNTSGSTFTRWPQAAENRRRKTLNEVISFLFKQRRGNIGRQQNGGIKPLMINEDIGEMSAETWHTRGRC